MERKIRNSFPALGALAWLVLPPLSPSRMCPDGGDNYVARLTPSDSASLTREW